MSNALVVVDMQNDFIDGALSNSAAQAIVDKIAKLVSKWEGLIVLTRDTHFDDYLETMEGKHLPVPHCLHKTNGWEVHPKIVAAVKNNRKARLVYLDKTSFGASNSLSATFNGHYGVGVAPKEIHFCGTCTDICVISNVLPMKALYQEVPIYVHENLCAGLTPEKHAAAIEVMKSCQVEVI